jgi:hypothetical protein
MVRFILVTLVIVGIGYGGWSLVRPDDTPAPLSSNESSAAPAGTPGDRPEGSGAGAPEPEPAAEPAAPAAPAATVAELLEKANAEIAGAGAARNREEALGRKDRARRLYSQALFLASAAEADSIRKRIDSLTDEVVFSEQPLPGKSEVYVFKASDRLWTLCRETFPKRFGVRLSPGFLLWVNGLSDPRRIREGQILKVPTEEVSLRVSKTRFRLWVLLGGVYIREFPVGIGKNDKTPEGEFVVETKIEKPVWYEPKGGKVPFGDPRNPLGTRWMGFKRTRLAAGYGIHGTSDPGTIGKAVSEGCIRMSNGDVEELFEWIPRGTKVVIHR